MQPPHLCCLCCTFRHVQNREHILATQRQNHTTRCCASALWYSYHTCKIERLSCTLALNFSIACKDGMRTYNLNSYKLYLLQSWTIHQTASQFEGGSPAYLPQALWEAHEAKKHMKWRITPSSAHTLITIPSSIVPDNRDLSRLLHIYTC